MPGRPARRQAHHPQGREDRVVGQPGLGALIARIAADLGDIAGQRLGAAVDLQKGPVVVIRIPQHGDHVGMDAAPGAGAVGPVAQPTVGIGDPLTESSTRTLPGSAGYGDETTIGSELVMDEDRLRGGSIGIDGDVHNRDVVSLGQDLGACMGLTHRRNWIDHHLSHPERVRSGARSPCDGGWCSRLDKPAGWRWKRRGWRSGRPQDTDGDRASAGRDTGGSGGAGRAWGSRRVRPWVWRSAGETDPGLTLGDAQPRESGVSGRPGQEPRTSRAAGRRRQ